MNKKVFLLYLIFILPIFILGNITGKPEKCSIPNPPKGIFFTENKGQIHDQNYKTRPDVLFAAMAGDLGVYIKATGVSYQLYRVDTWKEDTLFSNTNLKKTKNRIPDQQTIYRIDLKWLNGNATILKKYDETLPGFDNFYLASCPEGALNVKSYKGVSLEGIYDGISVHYYEKNNLLKHDYIVAPNVDYKKIKIQIDGAELSVNNEGSLFLTTPLGKVEEGAPIVFQNGQQLNAKWVLNNNVLSFDIENYNPNYELLIDPLTRLWGTYYGGQNTEFNKGLANDLNGNVFMSGYSSSNTSTLIATIGSFQFAYAGGNYDAFLVKFNTLGVRQWGTYYGDTGTDYARDCATDSQGNAYLTGTTWGSTLNVLATPGAHQTTYTTTYWGDGNAFLVKFNSNGQRIWGTYYGGLGGEYGYTCVTDNQNNIYMCGFAHGIDNNIIYTNGAHQNAAAFGSASCCTSGGYIVKFNSNGVRLWGTYYGIYNRITDCSVDNNNNLFVCGYIAGTSSLISTPNAFQPNFAGGSFDAFLAKFNSNGVRQWGTFYGDVSDEGNFNITDHIACTNDATGNIYMCGNTGYVFNGTALATPNSFQNTYCGLAQGESFLVKFNSNGVRKWGTYYGGFGPCSYTTGLAQWAHFRDLKCDISGKIYIVGSMYPQMNPNIDTKVTTVGSYQQSYAGGNEGLIVKFDTSGTRIWGSFFGGLGNEYITSISLDNYGNIFFSGISNGWLPGGITTPTIIATSNSHQILPNNNISIDEGFLEKFTECSNQTPLALVNSTVCSGSNLSFSSSINGVGQISYSWSGPNSYTSALQNPTITNASTLNVGVYTVTINNNGCVSQATTQVGNVYSNPTITIAGPNTICKNDTAYLNTNGAVNYFWNGIPQQTIVALSPTITSIYTVTATDNFGCTSQKLYTLTVRAKLNPTATVNSNSVCLGSAIVFNAYLNTNTVLPIFNWVGPASFSSNIMNPLIASAAPINIGVYTLTTNNLGCIETTTTQVNAVTPIPNLSIIGPTIICNGATVKLTALGASTYTWVNNATTNFSILVSPVSNTTYTLIGNTNNCESYLYYTLVVEDCSKVHNIENQNISIYPNPAKTQIMVSGENLLGKTLSVWDALGKLIYETKINQNSQSITISEWPKGIYTLLIEGNTSSHSFVKE